MPDADICFYFDPVCPFAWLTSKWVRMVQAQRAYAVDWRFISLRMINAAVDYDSHFPAGYEAGHTAGLRLLRVAGPASGMRHRRLATIRGAPVSPIDLPPGCAFAPRCDHRFDACDQRPDLDGDADHLDACWLPREGRARWRRSRDGEPPIGVHGGMA